MDHQIDRIRPALAVMVLLTVCTLAFAQKKSSCIECHVKLDDPRLSAPAKLFENPNPLDAGELHIQHASVHQAVGQQRLGLFQIGAVDDPVFLRVQATADGFSELRMGRQNKKGFHRTWSLAYSSSVCWAEIGFRIEQRLDSVTFPRTLAL